MIFIETFRMSRSILPLLGAVFWGSFIAAQEPLFREDQLYLGAGVLIANANQAAFSQTDFSGQLQLGFIRDFPLTNDSRWALGLGLGYDYRSLVSNLEIVLNPNTAQPERLQWNRSNNSLQGFRQSRIVIPLELRWRTATLESDAFWRIHSGVKCSYIYRNRFQSLSATDFESFVDPWQFSAHLVAGFNTWNFYVEVDLLPWLKPDFPNPANNDLQLQTLQLGVLFYFL